MATMRTRPTLVAASTDKTDNKDKDLVAILRRIEQLGEGINNAAERLERFRSAVYGPVLSDAAKEKPDRIQVNSLRNDICDALTDCHSRLGQMHECLNALEHFA